MSVKMESLSTGEEDTLASFGIRSDPSRRGYFDQFVQEMTRALVI